MSLRQVTADVADELAAQDAKWGSNRYLHSTLWGVIIGEEYGEVCEAILDAHHDPSTIPHLREELIQLIAVATQVVLAIDEYRIITHIYSSHHQFG